MSDNGIYPADTCHIFANDRAAEKGVIRCDAFGCDESHPLEHDAVGELGFDFGKWIGWIYIDLNRPDLFERPLRFCSCSCAQWWLEREVVTRRGRPRQSARHSTLAAGRSSQATSRTALAT
jgi:hypothetical protein